jgi:hypothetical protein
MAILKLIPLLFLLNLTSAFGQERNYWTGNATSNTTDQNKKYDFGCSTDSFCYVLQVLSKTKIVDTSKITPFYSSDGLYLLQNGVYNFIVSGKKYFYYRIHNITSDSIYISYAFDTTTIIAFSPKQIINIKFYSLNDGLVGWPHENLSRDYYSFIIVKQNKFCSIKKEKICIDNDCNKFVISNSQYMTSGFGWKPMYINEGNGYLLDNNLRQLIYRPKKK